jgi:hypothetical protein
MLELQTEIEINHSLGRFWRPGPPLSEVVDYFWIQESPAVSHQQERVLPTGAVALLINLRAEATPGEARHNALTNSAVIHYLRGNCFSTKSA